MVEYKPLTPDEAWDLLCKWIGGRNGSVVKRGSVNWEASIYKYKKFMTCSSERQVMDGKRITDAVRWELLWVITLCHVARRG